MCTGTWTLFSHPTPPVPDHERIVQCLCLQDSKTDDEAAVPDSMSQPRVPKCYPKGMIFWCSKWSTFRCPKWSLNRHNGWWNPTKSLFFWGEVQWFHIKFNFLCLWNMNPTTFYSPWIWWNPIALNHHEVPSNHHETSHELPSNYGQLPSTQPIRTP